jgi:uncharacterized protein (TIGR04222 family)
MLNPLLLHGGAFLLFYCALALLVMWGLRLAYRSTEGEGGSGAMAMTDPYLIACLRGGAKEALRVVTVALVDRGLLIASGETLAKPSSRITSALAMPARSFLIPARARRVMPTGKRSPRTACSQTPASTAGDCCPR